MAGTNRYSSLKRMALYSIIVGLCASGITVFCSTELEAKTLYLDGGNSPGTYEPDPDDHRRGDDHGGPYNEPGSDDRRGGGNDHGGPYNEPGSDAGPY